jgi:uncharacterized protein (DUF362 family)
MTALRDPSIAAVVRKTPEVEYPVACPFDPPEKYPELEPTGVDPSNTVYAMVRDTLRDLGLDTKHEGTAAWNPFGEFIRPGMKVFIKPNTVVHRHQRGKNLFCVIVHPSILRPVLDYTCKALEGSGSIVIGDSQLYSSDYEKMLETSGLRGLLEWYRKRTAVKLSWFDLRLNKAKRTWLYGRWARKKIEHDPLGYQFVDLGDRSRFRGIDPSRLRTAIASYKNMYKHHSGGRHAYLFPRSFLESDAIINVAKLKTHRRTGVSLAVKNYMGLPAYKDTLPHFMTGSKREGGDQYEHPSVRKRICTRLHDIIQTNPAVPVKFACAVIKKLVWNSKFIFPFKDDFYEAMWWGNDTIWRTLADLGTAVLYADKQGVIRTTAQRGQFTIIDGIIGGGGDGPLACDPVKSGMVIAGIFPAHVDAVAATGMGFAVNKMPMIQALFDSRGEGLPLCQENYSSMSVKMNGEKKPFQDFMACGDIVSFGPHPQWRGHVESEAIFWRGGDTKKL